MDLGLSKGMEPPLATAMIHHTHDDTVTTQNLRLTTTKPKSQPTHHTPQNPNPNQSCSSSTNQNPNPYSHPWLLHCCNYDLKLPPI